MEKEKFVKEELARFEDDHRPDRPFRVAISANWNGGDYAYGSHTEEREYADDTVGYAQERAHAEMLLVEAWELKEERNESVRQEEMAAFDERERLDELDWLES